MADTGIVLRWQTGDEAIGKLAYRSRGGGGIQNKGFGFIERHADGKEIFCLRSAIQDGNSLLQDTAVRFDVEPNEQKPGQFKARNVTGGVCFSKIYTGQCTHNKCGYTHERPAKVNPEVSVDDAVAAVAASRVGPPAILVDTVEACAAQCERLAQAGAIAIDFEGVNLGREGELLLAQLAADDGQVVLIDVAKLGASAFDEGGLRALLQSEDVLKLIFDARSDADALFHLCGCRLTHVCDCQVCYISHVPLPSLVCISLASPTPPQVLCALFLDAEAMRQWSEASQGADGWLTSGGGGKSGGGGGRAPTPSDRLTGLGKALMACPEIATSDGKALAQLKKCVQPLFVPEMGGSYETWRRRPLSPALIEYAAADVAHLHTLHGAWGHLISAEGMEEITSARIERAISDEARAKGPHMSKRDF